MKALKYYSPWAVNVVETDELECLEPDDVVINVGVCGICGTDVGIISGDYAVAIKGVTLGHETAGIVAKVGHDVTSLQVGDRVVVNPTYSCNTCRMCRIGNPNHCEAKAGTEAGVSYDGAFATQYRAKQNFLLKIHDSVSLQAASLTEPLSCTITGVDKLAITHTDLRACVIGAGPMGMLYLWVLYNRGVHAFLVENNTSRQQFAKSVLPPSCTLYTTLDDALEFEYGNSDCALDLVVDTTGHLTEQVMRTLAPGGKLLNVALKESNAVIDVQRVADKSLSIVGSIDSLNNSFERAYTMIKDGLIPAQALVSHELDFANYIDAFRLVGCDLRNAAMAPLQVPCCKVLLRIAEAS